MNYPQIEGLLNQNPPVAGKAQDILAKAEECQGLNLEEVAGLLALPHEWDEAIFASARKVKQALYGSRIVLFAPLYISNLCTNGCLYCAFRSENSSIVRKKLTQTEIAEQAAVLIGMGHKRILLEAGEDLSLAPIEYVIDSLRTIYDTRVGSNSIRRINVNIAATTVENYRRLKEAGIGTYQLFQETYHRPTYRLMHPRGPKADYDYHLSAMERAIEGGIEDFGIGALFGLYDYRFELLSIMTHAASLKTRYGIGPHTVSVPRLRPAQGMLCPDTYIVDDEQFKRIVAILRLALPYTGLILSTRESAAMRDYLLDLGISQMSAASVTSPGGYGKEAEFTAQFDSADHRSLDECVGSILAHGYIPSFCTGCYRQERTGEKFMHLVEDGLIKDLCHPNALLTLAEYLEDFASEQTKAAAALHWHGWLEQIPVEAVKRATSERLEKIHTGKRDLYL